MKKITIAELKIGSQAKKLVKKVLDSNRLTYGPMTEKFEQEFARFHSRKHAIFMNSGTSALQVGLHALKELHNWQNGDEVIVPSVTFVASVNVVIQNRLTPVFVDVEKDYYHLDPQKIEEKISKKTRAIMPVHLFGQSCNMSSIMRIAKRNNMKVIEDSCQTLFVNYQGQPAGSFGDIGCYSTYVAHIIATGIGGFATTDDDDLAVLMRSLMFHGRNKSYLTIDDNNTAKQRMPLKKIVEARFNFPYIGYSYRTTEMESALGLAELKHIRKIIKRRQKNASYLTKGLLPLSNYFQLPKVRPDAEHCFMLYPIVIKSTKVKRNTFVLYLEKNGIETRPMMPLLNQPAYRNRYGDIEKYYPVAQWLNENGFVIGCHQYLTREDLDYVIDTFKSYFA